MSTDFFDEDLIQDGSSKAADDSRPAGTAVPGEPGTLARHKEEVSTSVSDAASQIDRLRHRQEELEKEKSTLEKLSRQQDEYETEKRDLIQKLSRSIVLAEKEESQATRVAALFAETRARFRDALSELQSIDEDDWDENEFESELTQALAVVESAGGVYEKALARIEASGWQQGEGKASAEVIRDSERPRATRAGFGYWLKVGIAVSLPLIVVLILLFGVWIALLFLRYV
jgi:vacuolar-type H+-ATPase subunit I/STV1